MADKNITTVSEIASIENYDKVFINDSGSLKQITVANLMKSAPSGIIEESDPTVSEWAKQPTKPKYTAEEVGAPDSAVTTLKIADGNVTKAKLATAVQSSLDKADTALQKVDIVSGTANGTLAVDGTDVAVKGLNSAAFADVSAFEAAGTAESKVNALAEGQVATNKNDITALKE